MLALLVGAAGADACDIQGGASALRQRAGELYESGDPATADACISSALLQVTGELELLASQAQALRAFRETRQELPTALPGANGCIVAASGSTLCLPDFARGSSSAAAASSSPQSAAECGNEATALTLLDTRLSVAGAAPAPSSDTQLVEDGSSSVAPLASAPLDAFIVQSVQRQWWDAARRAVDVLRAQNVPPGPDARRAVTEVRDQSGALLALMRQTKMDEATISCAVMWAQGIYSVHLNVKFASRLDAPVTVLNVDNEQVNITENRITFSGIGRQKPKRYVVDIELYAPIDPNASSWSFGSVGTVRFQLQKKVEERWERLSASNESVRNHRVWWEKQEQVERADRLKKEAAETAVRVKEREEKEKAEQLEKEEQERAALQAKVERRAAQKPSLDTALAAVDALAVAPVDDGSAAAAPSEQLRAPREAVLQGTNALLAATGQESNETATATAEQLVSAIISLRSTGFASLTQDALDGAVKQMKDWLESHVEPEPVTSSPKRSKGKKRKSKASKKSS
jgi:flagellar biosynthesis GTPase FlhF